MKPIYILTTLLLAGTSVLHAQPPQQSDSVTVTLAAQDSLYKPKSKAGSSFRRLFTKRNRNAQADPTPNAAAATASARPDTVVVVVRDTVVVEVPATVPEPAPSNPIDTLNTADKFVKIVLYDNNTWAEVDLGKPVIDDEEFYDDWSSNLHAYRDVPVSALPEKIDLCLADSLHGWCCPLQAPVHSKFRFRKYREHRGVDICLQRGDSIRVAFDGVVRICASTRQSGGYGNLLIVRHPNGLETYYGHLSKKLVDSGEVVKAGEIIGLGGSTGRSTGPHLHFETRYMGKPFDPERVFDFARGQLRDTLLTLYRHNFSIYSHYGQSVTESKEASGRKVHIIKKGDTLGMLARKYGTSVNKICQLNGMRSNKTLRIGQRIIIR